MTLSPLLVYLWGIADSVKAAFGFICFPATVGTVILTVIRRINHAYVKPTEKQSSSEDYDDMKLCREYNEAQRVLSSTKPLIRCFLPACIFSFFACILTPSSKIIAVMVIAPAIVNSDPIQKDLPELYKAAKDALMETLKEAK